MNAEPQYMVLIVDDNPGLLAAMTETLHLLTQHRMLTARDGATGLALAVNQHPDCIIIDVRMPGLDGYQLVRALRGDPATETIPLVILTAMAQDKDRFAGLAAGADQYLLKPIDPQDFVAAIHRAVQISHADRLRRYQEFAASDDAGQGR
jgi:CheY-like chemotaxis protein